MTRAWHRRVECTLWVVLVAAAAATLAQLSGCSPAHAEPYGCAAGRSCGVSGLTVGSSSSTSCLVVGFTSSQQIGQVSSAAMSRRATRRFACWLAAAAAVAS